ncbi:Ankyrin repeats (3 copies) [Caulifigura coniformis]|uniref:Ankyrin repeats (3 copies) n=1 Tax=Caulifigura coniformis TaxID=2527983 RepID=A0A517SDN6_9PLAN|nr:ankyrin repeat domain-containing protein [Caulifigura coniformis]QDT54235.1 Ankyrin repeats (3 copies) [Caulifigura coniformis]
MQRPRELWLTDRLKWSTGRGVDVWDLFTACLAGDLPAVQRLIRRDASLVRAHWMYRTPLSFAVREGRTPVVAFLLDQGADPLSLAVNDSLLEICRDRGHHDVERVLSDHLENRLNASPRGEAIAAALRNRDRPAVRSLLEATPELLHVGDARSNQPIHWAVMTRQIEMVDELLERGADVNAVRYDGARPIQLVNGDYYFRGWRDVARDWPLSPRQMLDHLLANGAFCDLNTACHLGEIERVRELIDGDPGLINRVSEYSTYYVGSGAPLTNAAAKGHLDIVRLLLERGADPNLPEEGIAPDGHALYSAAANGHHEIARLLLEHGANPNQAVESSADALARAVSNGDQAMIDLLCSYGAATSAEILGYEGDVRTGAAMFAANPALADDADALCNAAGNGHAPFVHLILKYQPDLPRRIAWPGWLVGSKTNELNDLLFEHGMNPDQPDWLMITPLHQFARKGDIDAAACFLDRGANLHARDEEICSTPLGWAAKYGKREMVEFLLGRGARLSLPDEPDWARPLAWAERRGHGEIAETLRRYGAT